MVFCGGTEAAAEREIMGAAGLNITLCKFARCCSIVGVCLADSSTMFSNNARCFILFADDAISAGRVGYDRAEILR